MDLGLHELRVAGQLAAGHEAHLAPAPGVGVVRVVDHLDGNVEVTGHLGVVELEVIAAGPDVTTRGTGVGGCRGARAGEDTQGRVVGTAVTTGADRGYSAVTDDLVPDARGVWKQGTFIGCCIGGRSSY